MKEKSDEERLKEIEAKIERIKRREELFSRVARHEELLSDLKKKIDETDWEKETAKLRSVLEGTQLALRKELSENLENLRKEEIGKFKTFLLSKLEELSAGYERILDEVRKEVQEQIEKLRKEDIGKLKIFFLRKTEDAVLEAGRKVREIATELEKIRSWDERLESLRNEFGEKIGELGGKINSLESRTAEQTLSLQRLENHEKGFAERDELKEIMEKIDSFSQELEAVKKAKVPREIRSRIEEMEEKISSLSREETKKLSNGVQKLAESFARMQRQFSKSEELLKSLDEERTQLTSAIDELRDAFSKLERFSMERSKKDREQVMLLAKEIGKLRELPSRVEEIEAKIVERKPPKKLEMLLEEKESIQSVLTMLKEQYDLGLLSKEVYEEEISETKRRLEEVEEQIKSFGTK